MTDQQPLTDRNTLVGHEVVNAARDAAGLSAALHSAAGLAMVLEEDVRAAIIRSLNPGVELDVESLVEAGLIGSGEDFDRKAIVPLGSLGSPANSAILAARRAASALADALFLAHRLLDPDDAQD
ncbi:hypothetical protein [Streptomyces sp. CAI-85]|uniref:hypothetical protein n=1 Tax=Streptomyces sp. CAI-85 TaxID=1472662 RepID=UPI0015873E9E|nr:hypothetical protein [Streptomyces sp. CAI-85]NUV64319.1 hypothetical protein [Streptomyces sp. CAI-85]